MKFIRRFQRQPYLKHLTQLSIFILNYNGSGCIDQCINSFLQTKSTLSYDVVVVDNDSTDGSREYLLAHYAGSPRVRLVLLDKNYGYDLGFTKALETVKPRSEYLAFSNSDVVVEPDWLNQIVEAFQDERVAVVGPVVCDYYRRNLIQGAGKILKAPRILGSLTDDSSGQSYQEYRRTHASPYEVFFADGALFVFRSKPFEEIGGFDAAFFLYREQFDLGLRLRLKGYKALTAPASKAYHISGHSSKSVPRLLRWRKHRYLVHKNTIRTLIKDVPLTQAPLVIPLSLFNLFYHASVSTVLQRDPVILGSYFKALSWNIVNLRDTITLRYRLINNHSSKKEGFKTSTSKQALKQAPPPSSPRTHCVDASESPRLQTESPGVQHLLA
jgi:GT2 family glycosyltransferase